MSSAGLGGSGKVPSETVGQDPGTDPASNRACLTACTRPRDDTGERPLSHRERQARPVVGEDLFVNHTDQAIPIQDDEPITAAAAEPQGGVPE